MSEYNSTRKSLVDNIEEFLDLCSREGKDAVEELSDAVYEAGDTVGLSLKLFEK